MNNNLNIPASRVDHIVQVSIDHPPIVSPHPADVEGIKEMVTLWETLEFESEFREHRG